MKRSSLSDPRRGFRALCILICGFSQHYAHNYQSRRLLTIRASSIPIGSCFSKPITRRLVNTSPISHDLEAVRVLLTLLFALSFLKAIPAMPLIDVPLPERQEFSKVLQQLAPRCAKMENKFPMIASILQDEDDIRRYILITCVVKKQAALVFSVSHLPKYIVPLAMLKTMAAEFQVFMCTVDHPFAAKSDPELKARHADAELPELEERPAQQQEISEIEEQLEILNLRDQQANQLRDLQMQHQTRLRQEIERHRQQENLLQQQYEQQLQRLRLEQLREQEQQQQHMGINPQLLFQPQQQQQVGNQPPPLQLQQPQPILLPQLLQPQQLLHQFEQMTRAQNQQPQHPLQLLQQPILHLQAPPPPQQLQQPVLLLHQPVQQFQTPLPQHLPHQPVQQLHAPLPQHIPIEPEMLLITPEMEHQLQLHPQRQPMSPQERQLFMQYHAQQQQLQRQHQHEQRQQEQLWLQQQQRLRLQHEQQQRQAGLQQRVKQEEQPQQQHQQQKENQREPQQEQPQQQQEPQQEPQQESQQQPQQTTREGNSSSVLSRRRNSSCCLLNRSSRSHGSSRRSNTDRSRRWTTKANAWHFFQLSVQCGH
ncbi:hypothetical protein CPB84DRAFT_1957108 [Gymnopilus junonius]|uniref:Uncharacterized protein n=1 Tax=Gymnopilus junonius TaxID=109634 RepID=A0A9P5P5D4_GYMJU|nr:hypothetical protein CPB84DRAFT_1957108 [Gymnopilus junonius]